MKKVLFFAVIACTFIYIPHFSFGQKQPPKDTLRRLLSAEDQYKKYIPTFSPLSPNAAGIEKHGDYQVNLATGIPDIKIVLGNAASGSLNNPIVLRYHASGFKIDDLASWVGWGWSLDYGPSLNRSVRGQADDKDGTYGNNYLNVPIAPRNFCSFYDDYIFGKDVLAGQGDILPDLFSFNVFKNSGKFYLGQTDSPHFLLPFQPVKINKHLNTSGIISHFDLINQEGQQFVFGLQSDGNFAHETFNITTGASTRNYINNWLITEINAPNNNDKLNFEYQNGGSQLLSSLSYSATIYYNRNPTCYPYQPDQNEPAYCPQFYPLQGTVTPTETRTESTISQTNIYKINHENGYVEFEQSAQSERQDLPNSRYLKKIKFYNLENGSYELMRTITFNYGYFQGVSETRLKLQSLTINDASQQIAQTYQFSYFTNNFSWNSSDSYRPRQDYFGYYNGTSNTHLISVGSYAGVNINNGAANRETVSTYAKECVLQKITFPTLGYTEFDFENNQYEFNNSIKLAGGLRVKSIKSTPNITSPALLRRYTYGITGTDNIGRFTTNWFPENAQVPKIQKLEHLSTTVNGGSRADQAIFTQNGFLEVGSFDQAPLYYTHVKEYFEAANDSVKNGYNDYTFDFRNDVYIDENNYYSRDVKPWLRGNLLSKQTFNASNVLVESTTNEYISNDPKASSSLIGAFIGTPNIIEGSGFVPWTSCPDSPEFYASFPTMIYGQVLYQTGSRPLEKTTVWRDSVTTQQQFFYDNNLLVKKTENLDSYTNQKRIQETVYPTDASYDADSIALKMRVRNILDLTLENIEKEELNGNISVLFKQKTVYQALDSIINARGLDSSFVPKSVWVTPTGTTLEKRVDYTKYDTTGNVIEYKVDDIPTTLIWGYNKSLVLAQVQNANHAQVSAKLASAGITENIFSITQLSNTQLTSLETFRNSLSKTTYVSWFSYRPNIGLSLTISPNGLKTFFSYDGLQRLATTKDHLGYFLTKNEYYHGVTQGLDFYNKVITRNARIATTLESNLNSYRNAEINHQYFDGLGRPLRTIGDRQSPSPNYYDIIYSDMKYDKYGRVTTTLPIAPTITTFPDYNTNPLPFAQSFFADSKPYDSTIYESSPLNRAIEAFGVGNAWRTAKRSTKIFYESAGVNVPYYTVNASTGDINLNGTYPARSLFKKRIIDEQGNTSIEISDKRGRLIQKQVEYKKDSLLTTYFIYDGLGRELAIIQPEGYALQASMASGSTAWNNFVFFYKYDERGRRVESHIPNTGKIYSIFDKQDRQVLSQDEYQRTSNKWLFMKYDSLNRNIISGELTLSNTDTRASLQTQFNSQIIRSEGFDTSKPNYYTDVSFPFSVDSSKAMMVNYYDSYATWRPENYEYYTFTPYPDSKGLLTGSILRNTESRSMNHEVNYYDYKNRLIQVRKKEQNGLISNRQNRYLFSGYLEQTLKSYSVPSSFFIVTKNYTYDYAFKKSQFNFQIGGDSQFTIAQYQYDDIGRLKTKKIKPSGNYEIDDNGANYIDRPPIFEQANTQDIANKAITLNAGFVANAADSTTQTYIAQIDTLGSSGIVDALQTIDYEYYIRGGINCINCKNKQVRLGNKQNDLFSMKLEYNDDKRYFDGNISKQTWKTPIIPNAQQFKYSYDASSRLKKAQYLGGNTGDNYSIDTLNYDRNGNIFNLKRNGNLSTSGARTTSGAGLIDNLSYIYDGNKLLSVSDIATLDGFIDANSGNDDYEYWNDGSLRRDKNKRIDSIIYNSYLKKVSRVKFENGNWINFYYDGAGKLIKRRTHIVSQSQDDIWAYTDDLITKNGQVYQLNHEEGRLTYDYTNNRWVYEYDYRDNQGNLRLSFRDSLTTGKPPVITQIEDRDPTGVLLSGLNYSTQNKNNIGFINRETITETGWIDLNNRFFDPYIIRFHQTDPVIQGQENYTLFQYGYNNPVKNSDPDGRDPNDVILKGKEAQAAFSQLQASVQKDLTLSMDSNGKVTYTQNGTGKLSRDSKQLVNAINDNSIVVNVNAENTKFTKSGNLYIGGAYSGNTVTQGTNGNTVVAEQEVNPVVLGIMSTTHGKAGADMLHEVTEAYQGALISQKSGQSSPASNNSNSVYPTAHNRATAQSGQVYETLYDASNNVLQMNANGGYPASLKKVEWSVKDPKGNNVIIQILK
ncbi:hypothetical protein GCM10011514_30440 [Emticicia aquatilis]|uniref:DUF6443 domain-containing protein n=1 Tax=Emticicia aquatilis TaxID=1537369 RepID=A0A917DSF4_9BACT|nr:DUF6443 domain-containing protein [Emticicia aquatilis]GGD64398.1 hypothetical protein GCM10011514_30440 [Emticicia aquatilis]